MTGAPERYRAPWWMPGAHAQTMMPARLLPLRVPSYARERWTTPDGDFLDVDLVHPGGDAPVRLLVLFHGLEGDSRSHYSRILMAGCERRGWLGLVVHFRGCSGHPNRMPRAYHSGDSAEIDWVLARVAARWPAARRHAVGVSLGGNALAKWAGELGAAAQSVVATATVSAPFDLAAAGHALDWRGNRVYQDMFLRSLRRKALAMVRRFPGLADPRRIAASRSLLDFDDAFTAPVHGFAGVHDYWARAAARPWLGQVRLPLLALNAENDPFVPAASLPARAEAAACVRFDRPRTGGHVGFYNARAGAPRWYLEERVFDFFERGS